MCFGCGIGCDPSRVAEKYAGDTLTLAFVIETRVEYSSFRHQRRVKLTELDSTEISSING